MREWGHEQARMGKEHKERNQHVHKENKTEHAKITGLEIWETRRRGGRDMGRRDEGGTKKEQCGHKGPGRRLCRMRRE